MNTNDRSGSRRNNAHRRSYHTPMEMPSGPKSSSRRHPSQSPEVWAGQHQTPLGISMPPVAESSQSDQNRRKKAGNPTSVPAGSRPFIVAADEANSERGRKFKPKQRSHNRYLPENVAHTGATPVVEAPVPMIKRERSRSQDSSRQRSKAGASDVDSSVRSLLDLPSDYSGPLAAAEFARLKREVESLRKLTHENKKVMKKQNKLIEELRQQDSTTQEKLKESESQVQQLQSKAKKAEEFMTAAENNAQCQICMELLLKPYALSPCGHVLCVSCLQEWFRKAPQGDDDVDDANDAEYFINRRKSCPCCRTGVRHRPIPVFVVKSIATALAKAKGTLPTSPSPTESDPWEGLFPSYDDEKEESEDDEDDEDEDDEDEDEDEVEDEDYDEDDDHSSDWYEDVFSYGTDSDEEPYDGEYVHPQWEPPAVFIDEDEYLFDGLDVSDINILRRGGTLRMLHEFDMRYNHEDGLIAHDDDYNRYYLGWNIRLSADDENGEGYMRYLMEDMNNRPERWRIMEYDNGTYDAHLLVREDEVHAYAETDSDYYNMDVDDHD